MSNWYKNVITQSPLFKSGGVVGEEGLALLYPPFREKVERLKRRAAEEGLPFKIFETYRSAERQAQLFREGRTKLRENGMHHYGVAADFVPKTGGAWKWDVPAEMWRWLGEAARREGLVWGGGWKGFVDCPHVQLIPVARQKEIISGKYPAPVAAKTAAVSPDEIVARKQIVESLREIYNLAQTARLTEESLAALNRFRNTPELRDVKIP